MTLLIRNGRLVDPATGVDALLDILVAGGRIAEVGPKIAAVPPLRTIDATGLVVVPGLIDMHVHLREPGYEAKETIATGARAAACGGFTTVCAMPNTNPVNDDPAVTGAILAEAARSAIVNILPVASVTRGSRGEELVDMPALKAAGAVAFSDDGRPIMNSRIMRSAISAAEEAGAFVIDHCEDAALAAGGCLHEGLVSARLGLPGIPSAAEEIMIARDLILAEAAGARIHVAHISTAGGLRSVREAKSRGVRVSVEATPHHLLLTDAALESRDTDLKMNPPLRPPADVDALVEGLRTGDVDVIATDHAPHTAEDKSQEFGLAPFGVVGLETAVPLVLDRFVHRNVITLERFVELLSVNPARLLGLNAKGRVAPGADADLTILDLDREVTVDRSRFESKGKNTPFHGWRLRGAAVMTIVKGRIVHPFDGGVRASRA
ncbi:MAG: dihydroorotase [Candidatus Aminicenantes bacterium]